MGQTLSAPETSKHTDSGEDERYMYGVSEMQGWRISMEDAHTTVLNLDRSDTDKNAFFAVYDGHGGARVAQFSGDNVHKRLVSEEAYHKKRYDAALKKAFLGTDDDIRADPTFFHDASGCTAVAALLTHEGKLFVANAGDSRSIISVKGVAKPLSFDHKPQNETETSRIKAAGGYIEYGRVNGNLALSRAIGDFEFKKNYALAPEQQIITADPDIIEHDITDEDEFLVLACDGIWDCLSSQQVIDAIRRLISDGKELTDICNQVMDICLAPDSSENNGIGCDNMTVLIVALLNGRTKEEWYAWIKDRVANKYGYETPEEVPQIYSSNRLRDAQTRYSASRTTPNGGGLRIPLGGLAQALAGRPITFQPGNWSTGSGSLMFDQEDSGEEESEDDGGDSSSTFFSSLRAPAPRDMTKSLKAQLDELRAIDDDDEEEEKGETNVARQPHPLDEDDDPGMEDSGASSSGRQADKDLRQGEAPLPPSTDERTDPQSHTAVPEQLKPQSPSGDAPIDTLKVESLMDSSETPFRAE